MEINSIIIAFIVTTFAGLATGIGSTMALFSKRTDTKKLSIALGFSAGVMIYISFMELLHHSQEILSEAMGEKTGQLVAILTFFGGIFFMALIDRLVPLIQY